MEGLSLIALGVAAFVATNADDALLLILFFGDRRLRARHVFVGQTVGVGLLVAISLAGALLALRLPPGIVGWLGLIPIGLGVRQLVARRGASGDAAESLPPGATGWRQAASVAAVTVANGGDNIGVYVPLFAARPPGQVAMLLAVFAVMLLVWTFGGYYLARRSAVAGRLQRVSGQVMPWVLIMIGVFLLIS